MMSVQTKSDRRCVVVALGFAALAAVLTGPSAASEGKGDLNVQLRLVDTEAGRSPAGAPPTGVARIEVSIDAYRATEAIQLSVERPDGSVWSFQAKPFRPGPLTWWDPHGQRVEPAAGGPSIPARGMIRTTIAVPLERAAIQDLVVKVMGSSGGDALATEGALRVAFGVPDNAPVDDGEFANFTLQEVP
jgi:hypothetical protein